MGSNLIESDVIVLIELKRNGSNMSFKSASSYAAFNIQYLT